MTPVENMSVFSLIANASLPAQLVLLVLLVISIFSWAYIFSKFMGIRRAKEQIRDFENQFWKGGDLTALHQQIATKPEAYGPLARIFDTGMTEFLKARRIQPQGTTQQLDNPDRAMRAACQREIDGLEVHMNYLASTGSVSPYIGLFGTVWGVMNSFMSLSGDAQNTISAVAPGIAEALIATAVGLFAAIPAVVAYNYFANDIDKLSNRMENFVDEFLNILQRQVS